MLKRKAQNGCIANGTNLELQIVSNMVITLGDGRAYKYQVGEVVENRYWFTCRWMDNTTGKCMIYNKRPVLCRTYPNSEKERGPCGPNCSLKKGTDYEQALIDFKAAWGIKN
jgi:Fe-S-cluster containining protein